MEDITNFVADYYQRFADTLRDFDKTELGSVAEVLERVAADGGTLWVAGNGGSAAIADHTVCDTSKGTHVEGAAPIRCVSLASNGPMITAIGNDIAFDQIFRQQLIYYTQPEDALLLVSSSGNSPNVVEACRYAKSQSIPTIAFVGFSGGKLKELADHVVHIAVDNYGIVEDTHQSLMHVLTQFLRIKRAASVNSLNSG